LLYKHVFHHCDSKLAVNAIFNGFLDNKYIILFNIQLQKLFAEILGSYIIENGTFVFQPFYQCSMKNRMNFDLYKNVIDNVCVKKLLGLNVFTDLLEMSDEDFEKVLGDAVDVLKVMNLFD
jgi:hypothetical protein